MLQNNVTSQEEWQELVPLVDLNEERRVIPIITAWNS